MRILVLGGAGYIGSVLVPYLLHAGHLVTIVDNFMYNQTPFLNKCYSSNLEIIRADITNVTKMKEVFEYEHDVILPLACLTGAPLCNYNPQSAINVIQQSVSHLLESIKKDVKIIYPNTNSGYGVGSDQMCDELTPINPISLYGVLKCSAENMIMSRGNAIALRLATVFGASPRMRLDLLVNDFVYRAYHDRTLVLFEPHFRRNYIHVFDVAKAFMHCLNNWDKMKDQVYNVGLSSANLTKLQLAEQIKKHIHDLYITTAENKSDPDKRDYLVSNEKLEKTGWKATMTLDDGINELIKAYQIIKRNQYANI